MSKQFRELFNLITLWLPTAFRVLKSVSIVRKKCIQTEVHQENLFDVLKTETIEQ
mgnify:CR=1 FL=1